ncbi:hypothetical protein F503_00941 [Ophiostoma piceae UAMH 11346]|uniref:DNA/RNA-binding protein Alba-like domain-containing protein n=1 Tax=Ophiostoma piceae (strain UAMH 11346) TaxID=1262450 RepID=S3CNP1_OPHP1|nr:hypothetical protein F503_00941 [Ophiostoma piceae UAMH 11346]
MAGKRAAEAPPGLPPKRSDKKQKTTASTPTASAPLQTPKAQKQTMPLRPETSRNASPAPAFTVVPATPGTIVDLSANGKKAKTVKNATQASTSSAQQKQEKPKPQEPPTSLPLEPHAAILAELQHKHAVRVLSVISSTRMEKRIRAILDHLANGTPGSGGEGGEGSERAKALPGVVLLHARAPDANKLVSIAEIVKRRIREGHFAAPAADLMSDGPPKSTKKNTKKKGKDAHAAAVAWYQYDRIYDVQSARKKKPDTEAASGSGADDAGSEEEEDGFEPAMHRLEAALGDKSAGTVVTTYMSIILSRTPLLELYKNPEVSVQCSTDPLEVEYEQFMAGA